MKFLARNMWLIVPVQGKIKEFFSDFDQFPYQEGSVAERGWDQLWIAPAAGRIEAAQ